MWGGGIPNFSAVTKEFEKQFGVINREYKVLDALRRLYRNNSIVREHTQRFRNLSSKLIGAPESELVHAYMGGLNGFIRARIVEDEPETLRATTESVERWGSQAPARYGESERRWRPKQSVRTVDVFEEWGDEWASLQGEPGNGEEGEYVRDAVCTVNEAGYIFFPVTFNDMGLC